MKIRKFPLVSLVSLLTAVALGLSADGSAVDARPEPLAAMSAPGARAPDLSRPQADLRAADRAASAAYELGWHSVPSGGATNVQGGIYEMGLSLGQSAAGLSSGGPYELGLGFWYGAGSACGVALTGDVDLSTEIKLSDVIVLVNYVLKAGPEPIPCPAAGDVTCDGEVKSSDIIHLVNYVLKAGPAPCDVCTLVPGTWSCP
jgi:hypothetical protein